MDIQDFVKDNKLIVPEEEIDNIYVWVRLSKTQAALLSAKAYYAFVEHSFNQDIANKLPVLKSYNSRLKSINYSLSDFLTLTANKDKIFYDESCFVLSTRYDVLLSLIGFICQTKNLYRVHFADLSDLLMSHISQPEMLSDSMSAEILCLELYAPLPEHKLRQTLLNSVISRRCKQGLYTVIFTVNKDFVIGNDLMPLERLKRNNYVDLSPIEGILVERRKQDYKQLLKLLLSMTRYEEGIFVYSKEVPQTRTKTISRYE